MYFLPHADFADNADINENLYHLVDCKNFP